MVFIYSSFEAIHLWMTDVRNKIFKNGTSELCGRPPLKNLK